MTTAELQQATKALAAMFSCFPQSALTDVEMQMRGYLSAVRDAELGDLHAAIQRFMRGEVKTGNAQFCPSSAQLCIEVRERRVMRELMVRRTALQNPGTPTPEPRNHPMPRKAKPAKPQAPKLPKGEAEQVRIRREIGHDFALKDDAFGRKRLAAGTLEARRVYEVSNDGHTSTGGIVRVRTIDPLVGITSLSGQQREAGLRYRMDFQCSHQASVKPMRWSERVDGGRQGGGIADSVLDAGRAHAAATRALGHWEVAAVVQKVCCAGGSIKSVAEQTGEGRDVVTKLLKVGLDLLAVHYGMMMGR